MTAAPVWFQRFTADTAEARAREPGVRIAVARVRALAQRRLVWLRAIAGDATTEGSLETRRLDLALDDRDNAEVEWRWYAESRDPRIQALNRELEALDAEIDADDDSPLAEIVRRLGLTPAERDALHVTLAMTVEPGLLSICGYLHNDPECTYVSEPLVAQLSGRPLPLLSRDGALLTWRAVQEGAAHAGRPAPLTLDPYILEFASGFDANDRVLAPYFSAIPARESPPGWPVGELADCITGAFEQGTPVRAIVRGPRGSGRATFAACVALCTGRETFRIDPVRIPEGERAEVCLHALRYAVLTDRAIVWRGSGFEAWLRPPRVPPLQFLTGDVDLEPGLNPNGIDEMVVLPNLGVDERRALWSRLVPVSNGWPKKELERLAERYRVQIGDITAIGLRGAITAERAREECRKATRNRLGELGQLLGCPFTRDDLALSPGLNSVLDEFLFEAGERTRFWENAGARRLFPRGRSLVALMTGAPGTGKTMAAQVIAAELGLDLFRIDLAISISKYIGETAKNLKKIFARATETNAVLLFDEADALFSKRTEVRDAHDRHANTDTNYLLQMLEDFEGVALLASNRRGNIDTAFIRRIRFIMDFRLPEAAERLVIWQRLVRELAGESVEQEIALQLKAAADNVELSGAQIKLAVLGALFYARRARGRLSGAHLCSGITRELAKTGRTLEDKERERIERHDG